MKCASLSSKHDVQLVPLFCVLTQNMDNHMDTNRISVLIVFFSTSQLLGLIFCYSFKVHVFKSVFPLEYSGQLLDLKCLLNKDFSLNFLLPKILFFKYCIGLANITLQCTHTHTGMKIFSYSGAEN